MLSSSIESSEKGVAQSDLAIYKSSMSSSYLTPSFLKKPSPTVAYIITYSRSVYMESGRPYSIHILI